MPTPILIDLSHWNTPQDLSAAKAVGIGAAMIKITQGLGGLDKAYRSHLAFVRAVAMRDGAYHFGTGSNPGDAQAEFFLQALSAAGGIPQVLALDLEHNPSGPSMTLEQAESFVDTIHASHPISTLILYGGQYLRELAISSQSCLAALPLWLAAYQASPSIPAPWTSAILHQYTDGNSGPQPHEIADLGRRDYSSAFDGEATLKHLWNEA